jgi:curli biogenesis system outer membrane secretion channel CsgG
MMTRISKTVLLRLIIVLIVLPMVFGYGIARAADADSTSIEVVGPDRTLPRERGRVHVAPKKRIAVAKFDAIGSFTAQYGGWDIGGGLASQLTTALVDSGHFIVVERADLANVLREQEMGLKKIVSKETAAQVGHVLGAQMLVYGSVTEFDQSSGGEALRIGIASGIFGGALGGRSVHGTVAIDLRFIDTTTGQVIQSHRVEAKVSQKGISVDINVSQVTFGGDKFNNTALGKATRQAIEEGVAYIIKTIEPVPWIGRVVEATGDQVYINAGSDASLQPGDVFTITAVVHELIDPETGIVLGVEEATLGQVEVVSVKEKFSIARMQQPFPAKRGDIVKFLGQQGSIR